MKPLLYVLAIAVSAAAASPAHGQRTTDSTAGVVGLPSEQPGKLMVERVGVGMGMGVFIGVPALFANICFREPCAWGFFQGGLAGYWLGGTLGTALVGAKKCTFSQRFGIAMVGSLPGTVMAYGVARASYGTRDAAAVASTLVVGLSPLISSALFLRFCD